MNIASFDLNLLRVLDALLRCGSMVRAGEILNLSQPAVSSALGRLRYATGDTLFVRQGGGLVATDFALGLAGPVREILDGVEAVLSQAPFEPATSTRIWRLGAPDIVSELVMPALTRRLLSEAPEVRVQVLELRPDNYLETLTARGVDAAVFPAGPLPDWLDQRPLFAPGFCVALRMGHPALAAAGLSAGDVLPLDTFCALPQVLFSTVGSFSAASDAALARIGRSRRVVQTQPYLYGVARAVAGSDLIAVMPDAFVQSVATAFGLAVLRLPFAMEPTPMALIWHRRTEASAFQGWVRGLVAEVCRTL